MKSCPQCGRSYTADDRFCTVDGATLVSADGTATSLVGTVLADRYIVQERLGEGGMGEVYLAEHVRIKRKVAVKLMRSWMASDPIAVSRFHREAENASQISHPNVAQVYDFGETADGTMYLAMEFVPGEPLSALLDREGRLNSVRAAELVRQTAQALVAAHAMGILHRDLKPDNIMVARARTGTDVIKLVDFGIARVMNSGSQQFTSTGMILGTPDYMSPEQLTGDPLDERSDIYALALIAFRVLTGHNAFAGSGTGDVLLARLMNKPATLAQVRPDVAWPDALQDAFNRALNSDPAARHADALEFAAEFDGAIATMPLTDEEQTYLVLLSQRMGTPSRGGMAIDVHTPVISMAALPATRTNPPTGSTVQPSTAVATPPTETQPFDRSLLSPTPSERDAVPHKPGTATREPVGAMSAGERVLPPPTAPSEASAPVARPTPTVVSAARLDPPSATYEGAATGGTSPSPSVGAAPSARPAVASAPSRRLAPLLVGGAVAAAALAYFMTRPEPPAERPIAPVAAVTPESLDVALANAADSVAIPLAVAATDDSVRVLRARTGVLALANGRGTAIVVDSSGLLLTSASLVTREQKRVDLFVDGEYTVRASVVGLDPAAGLAWLRIAPASCKRCRPLELATADSVRPAAGDTLLVLPVVRRVVMSPQPTVIATVTPSGGVTTTPLAASMLGAPLFDARTGRVAGLVTRGNRGLGVATAAVLRSSRVAAGAAPSSAPLNDTLYRTWPSRAVPSADLIAAEGRTVDLAPFRVQQDGYDVLAMTPQVLAWRVAKSARPAVEDNPFHIADADDSTPPDPMLEWSAWRAYREERRAVVVVLVSPDKAAFPAQPAKPLDARRGDVLSVVITRDGTPLVPLERQRFPAVGDGETYRREKKAIPNAELLVYHPADFAATGASYRVEIADADPKRRVSIVLPPTMLQAVARDVAPWQR